ncbi:MAG: DUF6691 family protein [Rhizobiaceae bacterium]
MSFLINLALGLLFGVGLVVSGMSDPAKVLNFLDLFGSWDPSLAFVMGGAVLVAFVGYRLVLPRGKPIVGDRFHLPTKSDIDIRILVGPAIFGVGWGLGGFCPGPAITALGLGAAGALAFLPAMMLGMWAARVLGEKQTRVDIPAGRIECDQLCASRNRCARERR